MESDSSILFLLLNCGEVQAPKDEPKPIFASKQTTLGPLGPLILGSDDYGHHGNGGGRRTDRNGVDHNSNLDLTGQTPKELDPHCPRESRLERSERGLF